MGVAHGAGPRVQSRTTLRIPGPCWGSDPGPRPRTAGALPPGQSPALISFFNKDDKVIQRRARFSKNGVGWLGCLMGMMSLELFIIPYKKLIQNGSLA